MRKLFRKLLVATGALICVAITLVAQNRRTDGHPNFTGTWRLNRQLSDDPQAKMKECMSSGGGMTGALGRTMGGKGRKRGGGERGGGGKIEERMKNNPLMAWSLRIVHNDPEFQMIADNEAGASKTFFTDGRPVRNSIEKEGKKEGKEVDTETTARWQGEQLVITTQKGQGGKRILTYQLAQSGRQMIVSAQVVNPKLD